MLIPLTRSTFESLIPRVATGAQYTYCCGKFADILRRLLISLVGAVIILVGIGRLLPFGAGLPLVLGIMVGLYWLWGPVLWASRRNLELRRYPYSGFWRGEVLDVYVADELVGNEETVDERGDLVIVENRERCLALEVGDELGFTAQLRVPIKRQYQSIRVGDPAEMLVLSKREDLERISKTLDIYLPNQNLWVSDYPSVQREAFVEVSQRLQERSQRRPRSDRQPFRPDPRQLDGQPRRARQPGSRRSSTRRAANDRPSADWE